MPGKVPDRWEEYKPLGKPIPGTRFITFKVPLGEDICRRLPEEEHFTPSILLEQTRSSGWNLGMIIDLTNTKRYYKPEMFTRAGLEYEKIYCEGHVIPSSSVRKTFFSAMDEFLKKNADNDKLLGVHCTHGVNRTGFLVCRYMIDRLKMDPEKVLTSYAEGRGYPVERENYVNDLKNGMSHEDEGFVEVEEPQTYQNNRGRRQDDRRQDRMNDNKSRHSEERSWRSNEGRQNQQRYDRSERPWRTPNHHRGWDNWSSDSWSHQGGWGNYHPAYMQGGGYGQFGHNGYWNQQQQQQGMHNSANTEQDTSYHATGQRSNYQRKSPYDQPYGHPSRKRSRFDGPSGRSSNFSRSSRYETDDGHDEIQDRRQQRLSGGE